MITTRRALLLLSVISCTLLVVIADGNFTLIDNSFECSSNMICLGQSHIDANEGGRLSLIGDSIPQQGSGIAYYREPVRMLNPATKEIASFSTSFTFYERPEMYNLSDLPATKIGDGMAFVMVASNAWSGGVAARLGVFGNGDKQPKLWAVEYDNFQNVDATINDTKGNHVGVDIDSPNSKVVGDVGKLGLDLWNGTILHSWIEYNGSSKVLEVRLANVTSRPVMPFLTYTIDLYDLIEEEMWVGFSAGNGDAYSFYFVTNWTFVSYGIPPPLPKGSSKLGLIVGIAVGGVVVALLLVGLGTFFFIRRRRFARKCDDDRMFLDMANMPDYFSYKQLSVATGAFSDQSKLGEGGFGSVYRGTLPSTGSQVAVKRVSNNSRQGEKEFLAEVSIISQLRHRNVVQLMGYCRDRGKYLLVYELMPNGSLDKALLYPKDPEHVLSWSQRFKIVSGTAAALHYLHEGWRQQVIHRDVKSSNIMLDEDFNAKLGDFGLARLVDHQKDAATTLVAGTYGYIAPEAGVTGKFTDKTDVFAFGAVMLEVACGRKALDISASEDDIVLVDMVWNRLSKGCLLSVADRRLAGEYDLHNMEVVLLMGLLCSHPDPNARPSMRQVVQVLAGDAPVPPVPATKPAAFFSSDLPSIRIEDLRFSASNSRSAISDVNSTGTTPSSVSFPSASSFSGRT